MCTCVRVRQFRRKNAPKALTLEQLMSIAVEEHEYRKNQLNVCFMHIDVTSCNFIIIAVVLGFRIRKRESRGTLVC